MGQAYILARKRLSPHTIAKIDTLEDITADDENKGPKIAAARLGDILVTKKFHPAVSDSRAWLSTHHLGLIKELFGEGFVIEVLDEANNPITVLGEKNDNSANRRDKQRQRRPPNY